ncbi:MAG: CPBP family intramembrane glutamic endopeptidase [Mucinivorans sp.]
MNIRPLKLIPSAMIFISAAVLLWIMTHLCIPFLTEVTGLEPILFWFICGGLGVFTPLIIAGVLMLRKEGYKFTKETFAERLRFRPMTRRDWRYSLVALVVIGLLTCGIMVAMQTLIPNSNHTPSFMTLEPLSSGRYWILLAWLPYWLLNIGGEEFFWRGVLLPRQEIAFGNKAWILHGTGWAIFHLALGWQLLVMLLPLLYIESYVVQKTQNSWTGVLLHGVINGPSFIAIALGII